MKRQHPEQTFHKQAAAYLRAVLPEDAFFTTFPSGGGGRIRGAHLKAMGLAAGVPDLLIIYKGVTLFIELKAPKGVLSETQKLIHQKIAKAGAEVCTCRSLAEIEASLEGMPLTGRLAA